jgi:hypothetical protein
MNGPSFTTREGTWLFTKGSLSILFAWSRDVIYWMERFHYKRRNLSVYERPLIDFICTESWCHLLKYCSSTIRERTWSFPKCSLSIWFKPIQYDIYWMGALSR